MDELRDELLKGIARLGDGAGSFPAADGAAFAQEAWDLSGDSPRLVAVFTDPEEAADYADWRGCVSLVPAQEPTGEAGE